MERNFVTPVVASVFMWAVHAVGLRVGRQCRLVWKQSEQLSLCC